MIHVFQRDCVLSQLVRVECLQANTLTHSRVTSFISDAPAYWFFFFLEREKERNKQRVEEGRQDASYNSSHNGKSKGATHTCHIPVLLTLKEMNTGPSQSVLKQKSTKFTKYHSLSTLRTENSTRHISLTTK